MEHPFTDEVTCPTCGNAMQPVMRRSDYVVLLCADCRISITVDPPACESLAFPIPCPRCSSVAGLPYRVSSTRNGGVVVEVKCDTCAHSWRCTLPGGDTRQPRISTGQSSK